MSLHNDLPEAMRLPMNYALIKRDCLISSLQSLISNSLLFSGIQMIRMIRILAWIPPGDVHLAGRQIDHHGGDGALAIHGVNAFNVVIADRVRQVDMILLNGLQCFDGM